LVGLLVGWLVSWLVGWLSSLGDFVGERQRTTEMLNKRLSHVSILVLFQNKRKQRQQHQDKQAKKYKEFKF
jgi:hypothetical protein